MSDSDITQFVVDSPAAQPQEYYTAPPPAVVYLAQPRVYKEKKSSAWLLWAVLIVLIIVVAVAVDRRRNLARRLANRGWVLYTKPGCGYCTRQLAELGGPYPRQIDCSGTNPLCAHISSFPTWVNSRTRDTRVGLQSREELLAMLKQ